MPAAEQRVYVRNLESEERCSLKSISISMSIGTKIAA